MADLLLGILEDPDTWIGAVIGACLALAVVAVLLRTGRPTLRRSSMVKERSFSNNGRRSLAISRKGSLAPSDGGAETWYECIEEGVQDILDYPRSLLDASEIRVPLLQGSSLDINRRLRLAEIKATSVPVIEKEDRPGGISATSWSPANAEELSVRAGPNYVKAQVKDPSRPALYSCAGCDIVAAGCKINSPVPRLGPLPEGGEGWHKGLGIPRCIAFNCQFPFQEGPKLYGEHPRDDIGSSVVAQFVASPEMLRVAELEAAARKAGTEGPDAEEEPIAPAVRLLMDLFARGTTALPAGQKAGFHASGALKVIGWIEDIDDIDLPQMLKPMIVRYNGKPVLMHALGTMHRDESGEWMTVDMDLRGMTWLTKSALCKLRERFREVSVQAAFVIQGTKDEELPEVVLATLRIHGMDIDKGAWIDDPNAPPGSQPPEEV